MVLLSCFISATSMNPPFHPYACWLHKQNPCVYSQKPLDLCQCLFNTTVVKISTQVCEGHHYKSYVTSANAVKFNDGDSMLNPPLADALQVFQWVISHIPGFGQERIDSKQVTCQGHGNGGDGSCGLASLNFVEHHLDTSIPFWSR